MYKLNMSYLYDEKCREKIPFFILSGQCFARLPFIESSVQKLLLIRFLEVLFILLQRGEAARTACTAGEPTVGSGL